MEVRNFFENIAGYYKRAFSMPVVKKIAGEEIEKILRFTDTEGRSIVDIGCGYGRFCDLWKEKKAKFVVGVDFSEKMIREATRTERNLILGDAFKLPFKSKSFDIATCIGVANYYEDAAPFLGEMSRVAKKEIVITFPRKSRIGRIYAMISRLKIYLREKNDVERICSAYFKKYTIKECAFGLTFLVKGTIEQAAQDRPRPHTLSPT